MDLALALLTLFNTMTPGIAELIILIRKKDGGLSVVSLLDEGDADFDASIKKAREWLEAHPPA